MGAPSTSTYQLRDANNSLHELMYYRPSDSSYRQFSTSTGYDSLKMTFSGVGSDIILRASATLNGGLVFDRDIYYGDSSAPLTVNRTDNRVYLSLGDTSVTGNFTGGTNADTLIGGMGADTLNGGSGNDVITGGAGNDVFIGVMEQLSGDSITDFAVGDTIIIRNANYSALNGQSAAGGFQLGSDVLALPTGLGTMNAVYDGTDTSITVNPVPAADTTGPTLQSASVAGGILTLTYDEALDATSGNTPAATAFAVKADGRSVGVTAATVNSTNKTVTLILDAPVTVDQTVTVGYADPSTGNDTAAIQDAAGNDAATLSNAAVNNITPLLNFQWTIPTADGRFNLQPGQPQDIYVMAGNGNQNPIVFINYADFNKYVGLVSTQNGHTLTYTPTGQSSIVTGPAHVNLQEHLKAEQHAIYFDWSGGTGALYLEGGQYGDFLFGSGGNDRLNGLAGNDFLKGGSGADTLLGGAGADTLEGQSGADVLIGGEGADLLNGGAGNNTLVGGAGNDTFQSGAADFNQDTISDFAVGDMLVVEQFDLSALNGTAASGTLSAAGGEFMINMTGVTGGTWQVSYVGGDSYVTLQAAPSNGTVDSSPGTPPATVDGVPVQTGTVTHSDGSTSQTLAIPVVTAARIEQVGNNNVADIPLVTSGGASLLTAQVPTGFGLTVSGTGAPKSAGSSLSDLVREIQAHTAAGSADQAQLTGGGSGFLQGLPTNASLLVQTVVPTTAPGATAPGAPLVITGTPAGTGATTALVIDARSLPAGSELQLQNVDFAAVIGAVTVTGGDGSQKVWGDSANQTIILGADDDTLHGGGGDDYVGSKTGNDALYGDDGNDTVSGGEDNDTLYGNTGMDLLHGGKGGDELHGGKDGDVLFGDLGNDVLYGDLGADELNGNQESDTVHGGQGNDTVRGGQGSDQVFGDLGDDALWGDYGNDTLSGGAGADVFWIRSSDGHDVITDFNAAEGDRIGLQDGLSYTTRSNAAGDAVIVFSDGNDLTLQGVRLSAFSRTVPDSWFVHA